MRSVNDIPDAVGSILMAENGSGCRKASVMTRGEQKQKAKRPKSAFAPFLSHSYAMSVNNPNPYVVSTQSPYLLANPPGHHSPPIPNSHAPFYKYISSKTEKYYPNMSSGVPHPSNYSMYAFHAAAQNSAHFFTRKFNKPPPVPVNDLNDSTTSSLKDTMCSYTDSNRIFHSSSSYSKNKALKRHRYIYDVEYICLKQGHTLLFSNFVIIIVI